MRTSILIVEDDVHHINKLTTYLKSAHERYNLFVTRNAAVAIEIANKEKPDLIITDWELRGSDMNGLQIISHLKSDPLTKHIPIIMATAYSSSDMLDKALQYGASDYLRKPIDKTEILARVRSHIISSKVINNSFKSTSEKRKVLFLGANPSRDAGNDYTREMKSIKSNLVQIAKLRDQFELKIEAAATIDALMQVLLDERPAIFHFSGESSDRGIILEDDRGNPQAVNIQALGNLFSHFSEDIECVILNACYTKTLADEISKHIPYVIGLNDQISEEGRIGFATGFYQALGAGRDYRLAYNLGCINIELMDLPREELPKLVTTDK